VRFIFVDTSGWFATVSRRDSDHGSARKFFEVNRFPFFTTDYVIDETVTLMQGRLGHAIAVRFLDSVQSSARVILYYLSKGEIEEGIQLFRNRPDKGWSLTDCTSFVLMKHRRIREAFAFDEHFQQAGFEMLPE
jgi:predicted nucleic acid-binding protein